MKSKTLSKVSYLLVFSDLVIYFYNVYHVNYSICKMIYPYVTLDIIPVLPNKESIFWVRTSFYGSLFQNYLNTKYLKIYVFFASKMYQYIIRRE